MQAGELCSREVYIVRPDEPLADAAREMRKRHIGAVVVVEQREQAMVPVGIVTDRDIVCGQLAHGADLFCLTVGDVMTRAPTTIPEEDGLSEAIRRLSSRGVRRAPVVSVSGDLVGILSFDDVVPAVAEELSSLAKLIGTQARREV